MDESRQSVAMVSKFAIAVATALLIAVTLALDPREFAAFLGRASTAAPPEYAGPGLPRYSPFTGTFLVSIAPWAGITAVLWFIAARLARRIRTARLEAIPEPLLRDEQGRSAIEFILLLPILLSILLLILQTALMVQAKFIVNYAAFCAVRSAIVVIPLESDGGEGRNHIDRSNPDSGKMRTIWRAAALACVPISPHYSNDLASRTGISEASQQQRDAADRIERFFPSSGDANVTTSFKDRLAYAFDPSTTTIEIVAEQGSHNQNAGDYGDHDHVTVRVTHRFFLGIPLANRLLGTQFGAGGAFYYPITEQYTLFNEGEPLGS